MPKYKRCTNGHLFDPEQFSVCPSCGPDLDDIDTTQGYNFSKPEKNKNNNISKDTSSTEGFDPYNGNFVDMNKKHGETVGYNEPGKSSKNEGKTIAVWPNRVPGKESFDPVVGWLVSINGTTKGRDYRIKTQRNFIGRGDSMNIRIQGDQTISNENHAILTYDPKFNQFVIQPDKNLVYVNQKPVYTPEKLNQYDVITLGETDLMFIPFCNDQFKWF